MASTEFSSSSPSGRRPMVGYGSPYVEHSKPAPTMTERFESLKASVRAKWGALRGHPESSSSSIPGAPLGAPQYSTSSPSSGYGRPSVVGPFPTGYALDSMSTYEPVRDSSLPSSSTSTPMLGLSSSTGSPSSSSSQPSWLAPTLASMPNSSSRSSASAPSVPSVPSAAPETSLSPEEKVVDDITARGGVRPAPAREALMEFLRRCASLDASAVAERLDSKLSSPDWQVQLKSLHAMEALMANSAEVTAFFAEFPEKVVELTKSVRPLVATKARHVRTLITKADEGVMPAAVAPAASGDAQLLPLEEIGSHATDDLSILLASAEPSAAQEAAATSGVFAGMTLRGDHSAASSSSSPHAVASSPLPHSSSPPHPPSRGIEDLIPPAPAEDPLAAFGLSAASNESSKTGTPSAAELFAGTDSDSSVGPPVAAPPGFLSAGGPGRGMTMGYPPGMTPVVYSPHTMVGGPMGSGTVQYFMSGGVGHGMGTSLPYGAPSSPPVAVPYGGVMMMSTGGRVSPPSSAAAPPSNMPPPAISTRPRTGSLLKDKPVVAAAATPPSESAHGFDFIRQGDAFDFVKEAMKK